MDMTSEKLLAAFRDELQQTVERYRPYVKKAAETGNPQVAKLFRALLASETARARLIRERMTAHFDESPDYYVCPHCGLVFTAGAPDKCPVDGTAGAQFERIS